MTVASGYSYRDQAGARETVDVRIFGDSVLVGNAIVQGLGFKAGEVDNAQTEFARRLHCLSQDIAENQPDDVDDQASLEASLRLDPKDSEEALTDLRALGLGLRTSLSRRVVDALRGVGFIRETPLPDEPSLTFFEEPSGPTLWEMLYEGIEADDVDWRNFWGLRVPITHWLMRNRTEEVALRLGIFSAIYEDLRFAGKEVDAIATKFKAVDHHSLGDKFQAWARARISDTNLSPGERDRLETWWQTCQSTPNPPANWLSELFDTWFEAKQRNSEAHKAKLRALREIFRNPDFRYGLLHFACHCEPSGTSQFLSQLDMKVAGEPVSLTVAFIGSDLKRREDDWNFEDPGPFVFLNACGTGQWSAGIEPPGFPDKWIDSQGAVAVLSTLCPLPDYFAHAFALKFYDVLFSALAQPSAVRGRFLGEALLETRRYFMEQYNNPLGLAYVLHASKDARVVLDGDQP